jgi:hypothetical protein
MGLGSERGNAASSLFVAMADEAGSEVELLMRCAKVLRDAAPNCFELKPNSGKALRKCVVHLMCKTFAFFENGAKSPVLHAVIEEICHQRE